MSVVRRSIRIRGVVAWARWVLKPTLVRKSTGVTQLRTPGAARSSGVSERLDRGDPPALDQVARHALHEHPARARRRATAGSTYTAESSTASGETGAVGKAPAPGRYAGGAYSA